MWGSPWEEREPQWSLRPALVSRPTAPHEGAQASPYSSWGPSAPGQADTCAMGALSLACAPNTTLLRPPALQGRGFQQGCQTQSLWGGRDEASSLPGTCTC